MRKKVYGITYARIYGLTSDEIFSRLDDRFIWSLSFKGVNSSLPFNTTFRIKLSRDLEISKLEAADAQKAFRDACINEEDKVAVIYDVITGRVKAIGKIGYDRWIKLPSCRVMSFSWLGIKNCSLIPVFY